jgi:hypothetical protein
MKPNEPQDWIISLYGAAARQLVGKSVMSFRGTLDEALGAADEMESEVDFEVTQFVIRRSEIEGADIIAELTGALIEARNRLVCGRPNLSKADSAAVARADAILTRIPAA